MHRLASSSPRRAGGVRDHAREVGAQATTSQRLTVLGHAPTFNDTRVELAPG